MPTPKGLVPPSVKQHMNKRIKPVEKTVTTIHSAGFDDSTAKTVLSVKDRLTP